MAHSFRSSGFGSAPATETARTARSPAFTLRGGNGNGAVLPSLSRQRSDRDGAANAVLPSTQAAIRLTRTSGGMFHWSERTINKIESVSVEDKRMRLVVSMFSLFLNLMLDKDDNLSQACHFEEFMNEFSLRKANK